MAKFNQSDYIKQYLRENRVDKKVTFNRNKPEDMAILQWLMDRPEGMVQYIKRLIRNDMENQSAAGE